MSFRMFTTRLFKNGRYLIKYYCKRDINTHILENGGKKRAIPNAQNAAANGARGRKPSQINLGPLNWKQTGLLRFGQARRLFIDNILNRVTTQQSAQLRAEVTKKFLYGDTTPFLAFVGVGLASGNGLLTKDDELEGVCWEIRDAVAHIQSSWSGDNVTKQISEDFCLDDLNIGPPIDKGCAAVVYAASLKNPEKINSQMSSPNIPPLPRPSLRNIHNYPATSLSMSVDNLTASQNYRDFEIIRAFRDRLNSNDSMSSSSAFMRSRFESISENEYLPRSEVSSDTEASSSANSSRRNSKDSNALSEQLTASSVSDYPFALKMMFNYDIQSNAISILRAMYRETVPARRRNNPETGVWEKNMAKDIINLPAHPNIVMMFGVFCAEVPNLMFAHSLYPMALPARINPDGYGRNMSLFLLMKRYNASLRDYLVANVVDQRTSVILFAQLLEAIVHLYRYGVSHRDLKSDNILIDTTSDSSPTLVISDFGCCIADRNKGLRLNYTSYDIDKGGNPALMAPEIILKEPGTFSVLNYSKSDLWTCGTLAYEIFGGENPFYGNKEIKGLKNTSYKESELPQLPADVPFVIKKLVENILQRNPSNRLAPDVAANVVQLYLWAPSNWLKSTAMPSSTEILQWLLSLTTKVLCEARLNPAKLDASTNFIGGRRTYTEYLLISSFLVRARLVKIKNALSWIHEVV